MEEKEMASVGMNVDRRENGENAKTVDPKAKGDANANSANAKDRKAVDPKAKGDANPNNSNAKGDAQNPNAKKNDKEKKKKAGIIIGVVGLSVAAAIAAAAGAKGCAPNERSYTVTYLTDDEVQNFQGGSVNVKEGTSIGDLKRQLAPLDGYEVEGFYKDPDCTLEFRDDEKVNDDTKIYIEYKQIEITLIFHNENNPSDNDFGSMTVKYFDNLSKKEMPTPKNYNSDEGSYTFKCWKTLDGKVVDLKSMTSGKDLLAIDADGEIDLYSEFDFEAIKKYTLNFDKGIKVSKADGSEVTSGDVVKEGEVLTVEGSVDDVWTISVGEVSGLTKGDGNSYTVTGGDSETISITSKVEHKYLEFTKINDIYEVKGLKADADVTEIVIPDNHYDGSAITGIGGGTIDGGGAFENNSTITSVVIGANVRVVGEYAFYNCSALNSVEFKGSVSEYLGACSFANCRALQRLTLYPTKSYLWDVFLNCSNISEINFMGTADEFASMPHQNLFPNVEHEFVLKLNGVEAETIELSVSEIPILQFAYCTSIKNVILKDTVKKIEGSFYACPNLENITFGKGITKIGSATFSNCTSIKHLYLKEGLTEIGAGVFSGCNGLIDVILPASLTKIDDAGFYGEHVADIIFYYASTSSDYAEKLQIVGGEKESMTDKNVYYYSQGYPETFGDGKTYWHYDSDENTPVIWTEQYTLTFDDGIVVKDKNGEELHSGDFVHLDDIITIENKVLSDDWIYSYSYSGLTKTAENTYKVTGNVNITNSDKIEHRYLEFTLKDDQTYEVKGLKKGATETNIVIPDNHYDGKAITSIYGGSYYSYNGAFSNNDKIQSVTIGANVTSIGDYAFYWCMGLTSVTIGENVTSIGDDAFESCYELTEVNFTGTIDQWASINFGDYYGNPLCYAKQLKIGGEDAIKEDMTINASSIGIYAFCGCDIIKNLTLGENVTSIRHNAFSNCSVLTSVTIGDNVTSIESCAFSGCSVLTSVTIGDNVTSIGGNAFEYCSGLTEIIWNAANVTNLYSNLFYRAGTNSGGITVTFGDSVQNIPTNCFNTTDERSTPKITSVTIGKNVTSIGVYAFDGCSTLSNVTYNGTVEEWISYQFSKRIGYAFDLTTSEGLLTEYTFNSDVPEFALRYVKSLTSVTFGEGCTSIGNYAFNSCSSLEKVYYKGDETGWTNLQSSIGSNNDELTGAQIYYFVDSGEENPYVTNPDDTKLYWHYDEDGITPVVWTKENQ